MWKISRGIFFQGTLYVYTTVTVQWSLLLPYPPCCPVRWDPTTMVKSSMSLLRTDAGIAIVFFADNSVPLLSRCNAGLASGLSSLCFSRGSPICWQSVPQSVFGSSIREQAQPASRVSFDVLKWLPQSFSLNYNGPFTASVFLQVVLSSSARPRKVTTLLISITVLLGAEVFFLLEYKTSSVCRNCNFHNPPHFYRKSLVVHILSAPPSG